MTRAFFAPSREGHRRPYARNSCDIQYARARRNRRIITGPAAIARYERKQRREGRAA